jgi:hypothetical protein
MEGVRRKTKNQIPFRCAASNHRLTNRQTQQPSHNAGRTPVVNDQFVEEAFCHAVSCFAPQVPALDVETTHGISARPETPAIVRSAASIRHSRSILPTDSEGQARHDRRANDTSRLEDIASSGQTHPASRERRCHLHSVKVSAVYEHSRPILLPAPTQRAKSNRSHRTQSAHTLNAAFASCLPDRRRTRASRLHQVWIEFESLSDLGRHSSDWQNLGRDACDCWQDETARLGQTSLSTQRFESMVWKGWRGLASIQGLAHTRKLSSEN